MSDSALIPQYPTDRDQSREREQALVVQTRLRRSIWKIAFATLLLMAVGSATRVMNAGLACPDWPLCYGQLVPTQQMNLQVFLEWFHRLDAALIGVSTLLLAGSSWWFRSAPALVALGDDICVEFDFNSGSFRCLHRHRITPV